MIRRLGLPAYLALLAMLALGPAGATARAAGDAGGTVGPGGGVGPAEAMPIGCTSSPGAAVTTGPPGPGREVALTFDDGPKPSQTPTILATLEKLHAVATFFEEGRHVSGNQPLMRELLAAGDEIGNHSYDHPKYPDGAELASTDRRIDAATGFEPCLFRPPYGLLDGAVEAEASGDGLQTILWSLDSGDDHHRAVRVLEHNAVGRARPGSIILMHDGGRHPQTVAAVGGIVEGLRGRHLTLVTVTELLGGHFLYGSEAGAG